MHCQKTNDWAIEQLQFHMALVNITERSKPKYCGRILRTNHGRRDYAKKIWLLKRKEEEDQVGDGYR